MTTDFGEIRDAVGRLCADFPGRYWRDKDRAREYPTEFVAALSAAGYLAVLIPEQYGGSGLGVGAASAVLEEIHKSGCNGAACHAGESSLRPGLAVRNIPAPHVTARPPA